MIRYAYFWNLFIGLIALEYLRLCIINRLPHVFPPYKGAVLCYSLFHANIIYYLFWVLYIWIIEHIPSKLRIGGIIHSPLKIGMWYSGRGEIGRASCRERV